MLTMTSSCRDSPLRRAPLQRHFVGSEFSIFWRHFIQTFHGLELTAIWRELAWDRHAGQINQEMFAAAWFKVEKKKVKTSGRSASDYTAPGQGCGESLCGPSRTMPSQVCHICYTCTRIDDTSLLRERDRHVCSERSAPSGD